MTRGTNRILDPPPWAGWFLSSVEALAAVGAGLLGIWFGLPVEKGGPAKPGWLLWALVLCVAVAAFLPFVRQLTRRYRARLELTALDRLHVSLSDYLDPALRHLANMAATADADRRAATLDTMQEAIVVAAAHLCGPDGATVRANYFVAQGHSLVYKAHSQTSSPSTRVFINRRSSPEGVDAWTHAKSGQPQLWLDVEDPALRPRNYVPAQVPTYRTFATIGVVSPQNGTVWGMLNVDAPQPGDLVKRDLQLLQVLASLLATGHALASLT